MSIVQFEGDGTRGSAFEAVKNAATIARQKSFFPALRGRGLGGSVVSASGRSASGGSSGHGGDDMDDSLPDGWHAGEYDATGGCDGDGAELCLAFQSRAAHARASRDSGNARGGADDDDNSARAPLGPAFVRSFNTRGLLEWRSAAAGVVLANEGHATSVGSRNETEVRDDYEAMLRILPMKFGALLLFQYVFLWCFSFRYTPSGLPRFVSPRARALLLSCYSHTCFSLKRTVRVEV